MSDRPRASKTLRPSRPPVPWSELRGGGLRNIVICCLVLSRRGGRWGWWVREVGILVVLRDLVSDIRDFFILPIDLFCLKS
jgi:hypothetical protein